MTRSELTQITVNKIDELGYASGDVMSSTDLEVELGLDSIEIVEVVAAVCKQISLSSSVAPDARNVRTVADVVSRIYPLLAGASEESAPE